MVVKQTYILKILLPLRYSFQSHFAALNDLRLCEYSFDLYLKFRKSASLNAAQYLTLSGYHHTVFLWLNTAPSMVATLQSLILESIL